MSYCQVYHRLATRLHGGLPNASMARARNQTLVTLALALSPNCHLAALAKLLSMCSGSVAGWPTRQ